jgi:hypothetical protein
VPARVGAKTAVTEIIQPDLSVVVPFVNDWADLVRCLNALDAQRSDVLLEVLVVDRRGTEIRQRVAREFPWVTLIPAESATTIPDLRAMAFDVARADSVAVIEDHVIVPAGWAQQLLAAQARGEDVAGGTVYNAAVDRTVDWAAFLCEYSHLLPPLPDGPAEAITGNNTVYRRSLLERFRNATHAGQWENHLHDAFRAAGVTLYCRPAIVAAHKKHYTVSEYAGQRFLYARSYAGARLSGAPLLTRLAYSVAALMLPPLLFYRVVSRVVSKRVHRAELLRSVPLLMVFVCCWAAGEVVGYSLGPDDSLSRVC